MFILKTKVDKVTKNEAIAKIAAFLDQHEQRFITTPNSEIVLYAYHHEAYRAILNKADLALPDGAGLLLAAKRLKQPLDERVSGADMVPEICRLARAKHLRLALLGGRDQATVEKAVAVMRQWGNEVVYAAYGVGKTDWNDSQKHEKIINAIQAHRPDILLIGFGHPKQEQWIDQYRAALPSVRLFMGCGGTLDFIAGVAKRAPAWMRPNLEWLWRLITEPTRLKRIWNATIVFQLTSIYDSFRKK